MATEPPRSAPQQTAAIAEKRQALVRKYSASCTRPRSPERHDLLVPKVTNRHDEDHVEPHEPHDASSDSEGADDQQQHQHVTFEVVVQHLHAQLVQSRDELTAKDRRIHELEAVVASLQADNQRLRDDRQVSGGDLQPLIKSRPLPSVPVLDSNQL